MSHLTVLATDSKSISKSILQSWKIWLRGNFGPSAPEMSEGGNPKLSCRVWTWQTSDHHHLAWSTHWAGPILQATSLQLHFLCTPIPPYSRKICFSVTLEVFVHVCYIYPCHRCLRLTNLWIPFRGRKIHLFIQLWVQHSQCLVKVFRRHYWIKWMILSLGCYSHFSREQIFSLSSSEWTDSFAHSCFEAFFGPFSQNLVCLIILWDKKILDNKQKACKNSWQPIYPQKNFRE